MLRHLEGAMCPLNLMPKLELDRCPHCSVHLPHLNQVWTGQTRAHDGSLAPVWSAYACQGCGGVVTAFSYQQGGPVVAWFPQTVSLDPAIPSPAIDYLQ